MMGFDHETGGELCPDSDRATDDVRNAVQIRR